MVRALPDPIRGLQDRSRLIANPWLCVSESYPVRLMQCGAHAHHRPDCQPSFPARDIRRIIANASNLQIADRVNIVMRVLTAAHSFKASSVCW